MPPDRQDPAFLWDMLEAAREACGFVEGLTFKEYTRNRMVQRAVERSVEIIGEAARNVSEAFRAEHPEIPWRSIIGQRNVLAHEYGEVRQERLWLVATVKIPELIPLLEPLVPAPSEQG
jgi:uncharacterized protein with HEPN domain